MQPLLEEGPHRQACRNRDRPPGAKPVRRVSERDTEEDPIELLMAVPITGKYTPPLEVRVLIDNCSLPMELDTGASRSVISENKFGQLWPDRKLESSTVRLQTYSQEPLSVMGQVDVAVEYNGQNATLTLLVVDHPFLAVFGCRSYELIGLRFIIPQAQVCRDYWSNTVMCLRTVWGHLWDARPKLKWIPPASLSAYHRPQPFFRGRWSTYSRAFQGWWCTLMTSWSPEKMRQVI